MNQDEPSQHINNAATAMYDSGRSDRPGIKIIGKKLGEKCLSKASVFTSVLCKEKENSSVNEPQTSVLPHEGQN